MADRDDPQHDEMRQRLDDVASGIEVGDPAQARTEVDDVVGRRRTRRRVGTFLGAAAVVAVAATTVVLSFGGNEPDTLVTSDVTAPDQTAPDTDEADESPEPTLALPAAAAQPVELIDVTARPGSAAGANGAPEYGEWVVPWEDGFLVGSMSFPPQPLPDELPAEVIALFPQEVIDFFDGDLPDTISEAIEQLSEAGLLEVVSDVIRDNPAANEAIYGAPTAPPTLDVRFTVDGATWEPREVVMPAGGSYLSSVTAVGGRLVVVFGSEDPSTGRNVDGRVTVATTSDLTNWTAQDIVVPPPGELPDGINWNVFAQGLVANESGWLLSVYDSIDADPMVLLPVEVQEEINSNDGFGFSTDGQGITIEYGFDADGGNPSEARTFTWDELGVAPETAQLLDAASYEPTLWASTWEGQPAPAEAPELGGPMAATPDGFLLWNDQTWFSPDGLTWTASPLPDDAAWVSGAFSVDGGLVVMSQTNNGVLLIDRVDERGQNAVALDLPLPDAGSLSVGGGFPGGSATSGTVVSVEPPTAPDEQLAVEVDGYRLSMIQQSGVFEVVDVASGEVIVRENPFLPGNDDSPIQLDEAGITVTDTETGEVLVVFSADVLDAAESEFFGEGGGDYTPDFWLLASLDGERFVVDDIDDVTDGPISLSANGTRLLLQSGSNWILYDLA